MSIGLFTDEVIDHFSNPRNAGEMEDANGIGDAGDPGCGDTMRLYIKVEDDLIKDVSFKICGCVAALASASVTTVLVKGKTIDEALMITNKDISDALGGLPEQSYTARKEIADALANGKRILLSGGNYCLDDKGLQYSTIEKGSNCMRIAATYKNGEVFQHFGHTEQFKLYDVENDAIVKEQVVDTHGQGHGALAGFLKQAAVDILICGGIGGGAKMALAEAGIKLYAGISGNTDEAVKSLIAGNLQQITDATCSHHHGKDHACGEHACGHHEGDQGCREHHGGDHKCGHHN